MPSEIITNIVTTLTDINDIRNCMELSKDVNNFIYRTPKIINKFKFNFDCINDYQPSLNFIKHKGTHIKSIEIKVDSNALKIMKNFFLHTPKLEHFTLVNKSPIPGPPAVRRCFCCGSRLYHATPTLEEDWKRFTKQCWTPKKGSVELLALKSLEIELRDLDDFIRATKQVRCLVSLTVYVTAPSDQRIMNEFIMQQKNLKELTLILTGDRGAVLFPTRDVIKDVKFRLRKLKIHTKGSRIYSDTVDGFLWTQAACLEELEVDFSLPDSNLQMIFGNFQRLRKFVHKSSDENALIRDPAVGFRPLERVNYYEDMTVQGLKLYRVWYLFPNIRSLKCSSLKLAVGNYYMLTVVDVQELDISNLKNASFSNLRKLSIGKLKEVHNEDFWIGFVNSIRNVSNLTISGLDSIKDFLYIIKSLIIFTKLEKFNFRYNPGSDKEYVMDSNEAIPNGRRFYKILIDVTQKTVKVSTHIVKKCKGILGILIQYFKDFEFVEFCFNEVAERKLDVEKHKIDVEKFLLENLRSQRRSLRSSSVWQ